MLLSRDKWGDLHDKIERGETINWRVLVGYVPDEVELKMTAKGTAWCSVTVLEEFTGDDGTDRQAYHRIPLFREDATEAAENIPKGATVLVMGPVRPKKDDRLAWADGKEAPVRVLEVDNPMIEVIG